MTTFLPLPRPRHDDEHRRVHHGLLRFVREAAQNRTPLPGELELTARLDCTRQQLRNAMAELETQGIVRRRQGTVTTVDPIALRLSVRLEEHFEHVELLHRLGYRASVETLSSEVTALSVHLAALMELPDDTHALTVRKRWLADEAVAMVADDVVPVDADFVPDRSESVFAAAARACGEQVIWEVTTPGVMALDDELAAVFERPVGTPVMTFEFIGIGASGRRLMHSREYHAPEIASYSLVRTVRPPWGGL